MSNLQIYHVSKNLFDYKTVYAPYINANGDIAANASDIKSWNNFTSNDVGKTLTISIYVKNVSVSYIRVQGYIGGNYITGNNISAGTSGYSVITVTPTSTDDTWRIIYGENTYVEINQVMVNEGNTRLPYEPYTTDIWHDLAPQQYINGEFVDNANISEKYSGGSWS